ncbi:MAG: PD-(D/E)XK nuclease family protein [Flavobacteriales bacterium]|nr:PD-(D/E)XK nuclease family protein [Flavobacteriales bacterium]
MERFLEKLAKHLFEKYPDQLDELCIVLPNRRSSLFLKQYLAKQIDNSIWSPQIYSVEDFITDLSELKIIDPIALQFDFYEVYKKSGLPDIQSFDDFSKWSISLLGDFDEIDQYLVNTSTLFSNLADIKEIESWSLSEDQLTEMQQKYIGFWNSIGTLYTALNKDLEKRNFCYKGKAYRNVAKNILPLMEKKAWKKIVFAGFNALSIAEEKIIEVLLKEEKAEILWDTDSYYLDNKKQEAGSFLRKHRRQFGVNNFNWQENLLSTDSKNIEVIGVARSIGQAKYAGQILSTISPDLVTDTAIVLADEQLLLPVLQSLPDEVSDINITMGYPMINTPIYGLIEAIFNLHVNTKQQDDQPVKFYYKDVLSVINHPYFASYLLTGQNKLAEEINKSNKAFITIDLKSEVFSGFSPNQLKIIVAILVPWDDSPTKAITGLLILIDQLKKGFIGQNEGNKNLNLEYLFAFAKAFKRVKTLIGTYDSIGSVKSLSIIFRQLVKQQTLPFYGEPLKGLQIMGMLETRTLDFENVILLSANEDVLPKSKSQSSVIPFDLRKSFGLPTFSEKDAIFAYHYYRLIQRAKNVYILYNTESDFMGSGEPSRFIKQMVHELPKVNPNINIKETLLNIPPKPYKSTEITVKKTDAINLDLDRILEKGLSASSLNTYLSCPLNFYYKYIVGLKEPEAVEETIEAKSMGTFVHDALNELYKPLIGKVITETALQDIKQKANNTLEKYFLEEFTKQELFFGKNFLVLKVAIRFLHNFIDLEINTLKKKSNNQTRIISLEDEFKTSIPTSIDGVSKTINLKGRIDRIDDFNGTTRVIDFKTGNTSRTELRAKTMNDVFTNSSKAKCVQLLFYALLYKASEANHRELSGQIVSLGKISSGHMDVQIAKEKIISDDLLEEFTTSIKSVVAEMYNKDISFQHAPESKYCQFCGL